MYDKTKFRLLTCYHCGNRGLMPIEFVHEQNFGGYVYDTQGKAVDRELEETFLWHLVSCPVCGFVTLMEEYNNECMQENDVETSILYPQCTINYTGVPETVKEAFESALKVKNIDKEICALSLRRVLEAICKDKGATGKDLNSMVQDMIARKILPEMFNDACWIIRQLGNSAAHADNIHFPKRQVDETMGFVQSIINYLYILPVKMKKMRRDIETDKSC